MIYVFSSVSKGCYCFLLLSFLLVWDEVLGSGVGCRLGTCIVSFSSPRAAGTKLSLMSSRKM